MSTPAASSRIDAPSALPLGTRLAEFELRQLLGVGGFGIVYLAFDHALEREVAVKEYMPASLAGRTETMHVSLRSQSDAETFALGLKSFVNEARLLARFDHPSLLKVHRFWEANGTAYMAMPVMRGRTLKDVSQDLGVPPNEAWLRALIDPLLGAIERLHSEGVYHRDIAPDNIQIEPDGHPVLLDFGAARRVLSDKSQTLTAILKPAYAPIEQYAEVGAVRQGPWTDLYALGATLHYVLLKRPPAPATARTVHDEASILTTERLPGCSENFLRTLDWMMAPRPLDRPQSVAALREVLDSGRAPPWPRAVPATQVPEWDATLVLPSTSKRTSQGISQRTAALPPNDDPDATHVVTGTARSRTHTPALPVRPQGFISLPSPMPAAPVSVEPPTVPRQMAPLVRAQASVPTAAPAPAPAPVWPAKLPAQPATPEPTPGSMRQRRSAPLWLGGAAALAGLCAAVMWWPRGGSPPPAAPVAVIAAAPAVPATASVPVPSPTAAVAAAPTAVETLVPPAPAPTAPPPQAEAPAPADRPPAANLPAGRTSGAATLPRQSNSAAGKPPNTGANKPAPRTGSAYGSAGTYGATPAQGAGSTGYAGADGGSSSVAPPPASNYSGGAGTYSPPVSPVAPVRGDDAPVAPPPVAAAAKTPEGICGARNPLRYFVCMERECLRSEFGAHPDCLQWRKNAKRE